MELLDAREMGKRTVAGVRAAMRRNRILNRVLARTVVIPRAEALAERTERRVRARMARQSRFVRALVRRGIWRAAIQTRLAAWRGKNVCAFQIPVGIVEMCGADREDRELALRTATEALARRLRARGYATVVDPTHGRSIRVRWDMVP